MSTGEGGTSESVDKHYGCLPRFWILLLGIDAHPVNIKKLAVPADHLIQRYFSLSLTEWCQVGKNANEEKESQHQVRQYRQRAVSAPEASHDYIILILRVKAHAIQ